MNVVDSSAWLEYFADGPNAAYFASAVENTRELLVPAICIAEVFRRVDQQRGEDAAVQVVALMHQGHVVPLDSALAVAAGKIGNDRKLPLADSIVYATALAHAAVLWTQDSDFENMPGVRFRPKRK